MNTILPTENPAKKPSSFWQSWLHNIEQTLLNPAEFFKQVATAHANTDDWDTPYVRQGLVCVVLVAVVLALQQIGRAHV